MYGSPSLPLEARGRPRGAQGYAQGRTVFIFITTAPAAAAATAFALTLPLTLTLTLALGRTGTPRENRPARIYPSPKTITKLLPVGCFDSNKKTTVSLHV